jgi:ADP-ribosylglycohydrolase
MPKSMPKQPSRNRPPRAARSFTAFAVLVCLVAPASFAHAGPRTLARDVLRDRIRGAWAGQMIGVVYGAPTEFKSLGKINEGEIKRFDLSNAIVQDDLYVEMTFARVMDTVGLDATTADYGEAFKNSKYDLWHANAGARRNLNRGIQAPLSGHPRYNIHADDIDFQIEADFIGIMCPGLPRVSNQYCDRVGRVMNYGDGLYGGMFVCGMYTAAYFESDPRKVVAAGLACIPARSPYAQLISDLLAWSAQEPKDWRKVWQRVEAKWDHNDVCPDGVFFREFNIDAKLNGAYIAFGLLYGQGDWQQTMEIATRCGQDSDCNPSSACGVLGAMIGYAKIPEQYKPELAKLADTKFSFTEYSFNDIVKSTEARALKIIRQAGGQVSETEVVIPRQSPRAPKLTRSNFGVPVKVLKCQNAAWDWEGDWAKKIVDGGTDKIETRMAEGAGSEVTLKFNGSGLALVGDLSQAGGRADVYMDGLKCELVADAYIAPKTSDHDLWRIHGLKPGEHTLRLVMRSDADPGSQGRKLTIGGAVVYLAKQDFRKTKTPQP